MNLELAGLFILATVIITMVVMTKLDNKSHTNH